MNERIRIFFCELSEGHFLTVFKNSAAKLTVFVKIGTNQRP